MVLFKYQSSASLQVMVLSTLASRGVQLLHEQWLKGHSWGMCPGEETKFVLWTGLKMQYTTSLWLPTR